MGTSSLPCRILPASSPSIAVRSAIATCGDGEALVGGALPVDLHAHLGPAGRVAHLHVGDARDAAEHVARPGSA